MANGRALKSLGNGREAIVGGAICLSLGERALSNWLVSALGQQDGGIVVVEAGDAAQARDLLEREPVAMVLLDMPTPTHGGSSLSSRVPLRSISYPPAVALVDRALSEEHQELLRLAGVATVIERGPPSAALRAQLTALAASRRWFRTPIGALGVADVLQTIESRPGALMLTACCPHWRSFSEDAWPTLARSACRAGEPSPACRGWFGRVYLVEGRIARAETPWAIGAKALAQLMELQAGEIHLHDQFIHPPESAALGTVKAGILIAAAAADDWSDGAAAESPSKRDTFGSLRAVSRPPADDIILGDVDVVEDRRVLGLTGKVAEPMSKGLSHEPSVQREESHRKTREVPPVKALIEAGLKGVAQCDENGWVTDKAGVVDAESVCAAATMSRASLEQALDLLGLGAIEGWAVKGENASVYAIGGRDELIVAQGDAKAAPEVLLARLIDQIGRK